MTRFLPSFRTSICSGESIDGMRAAKGRYFQIDWLGFQFTVELSRLVR